MKAGAVLSVTSAGCLVQGIACWAATAGCNTIRCTDFEGLLTDGFAAFLNAEALYLIEGAGQVGLGLSWGDGYAHHRALLDSAKAVSDPTNFFDSLVWSHDHDYVLSQHGSVLSAVLHKAVPALLYEGSRLAHLHAPKSISSNRDQTICTTAMRTAWQI